MDATVSVQTAEAAEMDDKQQSPVTPPRRLLHHGKAAV